MLRSVFTVRHGRLAVAFDGGTVLEAGPNRCGTVQATSLRNQQQQQQEADEGEGKEDGQGGVSKTTTAAAAAAAAAATTTTTIKGTKSKPQQSEHNKNNGNDKPATATTVDTIKKNSSTTNNNNNNDIQTYAAVDLAYSSDASTLVVATEDKHLNLWHTTVTLAADPGEAARSQQAKENQRSDAREKGQEQPQPRLGQGWGGEAESGEEVDEAEMWSVAGTRELPKKPTRVLFAEIASKAEGEHGSEVLVVSDKCGDAYAAPLPNPGSALKHLLGHTAMTITSMVSLKGGKLLATGDRAEHIRVSQFPRTTIVHTYLLGHKDFVSALAAVPAVASKGEEESGGGGGGGGGGGILLVSGGGDGMVGLWDVETGEGLSMLAVREACQQLADDSAAGDARRGDELAAVTATEGPPSCPQGNDAGVDSEEVNRNDYNGRGSQDGDSDGGGGGGGGGGDGDDDDHHDGRGDDDIPSDPAGRETTTGREGKEDGAGPKVVDNDVVGDGVPVSIACSEDGRTVAVVVSGLAGLLLLRLSCGKRDGDDGNGGSSGNRYRLSPLARLQLQDVPIQAGFLEGVLIVALPSPNVCLQAFRLTDDGVEWAVEVEDTDEGGVGAAAARACAAINERAKIDGLVLKPALSRNDAAEALAGGLRKHKGTRNAGKSPSGWNNFSKRRDKNKDRKRKRSPWPGKPAVDVVRQVEVESEAALVAPS